MFGTNPLRKQEHGDGLWLQVQEIFSTIQGEGPFSGQPAIFVRLAGCNLRCYFCDTQFESGMRKMPHTDIAIMVEKLATEGKSTPTNLVVITGGEPMRQNIYPLCVLLIANGYRVQIETAGTLWVDNLEQFIYSGWLTLVCSPKTGAVHSGIEMHCKHWKYLIQEGCVDQEDGLPNMSTQVVEQRQRLYRPPMTPQGYHTIWLQPCEAYKVEYRQRVAQSVTMDLSDQEITSTARDELQTRRNIELCGILAMKHNYRISLQLHKILHLP